MTMRVLGIETSCDETSVAVVEAGDGPTRIVGSLVSSQIELHQEFGGVVPELATREHLRNLPLLTYAILQETGLRWQDIDALAVTQGPGLASSLLIGHSFASALSLTLSKPLWGVNHLEGHLFSPFLANERPVQFPFTGLIVSGGHTLLMRVGDWNTYWKIGATVDDAAGEVFDKVARLMDMPYPGGPEIERTARSGNPQAYDFPRSFSERHNYQFSFSGLKTAVRYFLEKNPNVREDPDWQADICASFQQAVIDVLVRKTISAAQYLGDRLITASGGVTCNQALKRSMAEACEKAGIELLWPTPALSTDNASMIAAVVAEKAMAGKAPECLPDVDPNLVLAITQPGGEIERGMRSAKKLKDRQTRESLKSRAVL